MPTYLLVKSEIVWGNPNCITRRVIDVVVARQPPPGWKEIEGVTMNLTAQLVINNVFIGDSIEARCWGPLPSSYRPLLDYLNH